MTGVGRGIGYALVGRLLTAGWQVTGTIRPATNPPVWPGAEQPHIIAADATDMDQTAAAVDAAVVAMGGPDVIVANAGAGRVGGILDATPELWHEQCMTKLFSVSALVDAALPPLRRSPSPRIVIVGGITALVPDDEQGVVSAMRAAQVNLVINLARQLASERICVNAVLLGAVLTDRQRDKFTLHHADDFDAWMDDEVRRRAIPFGRFASVDEATAAIAFLASVDAGYITGALLPVSGGLGI